VGVHPANRTGGLRWGENPADPCYELGERQTFVGNPTNGPRVRYSSVWAALPLKGVAAMPTIAAPALTANRIDYWIPPNIIQYCYGTHPSQNLTPRGGRRVGMLAIGKCLKDQYDALATPTPPHLAALVKKLKTQERG
jgi:hypothetical protein